MAFKEFILPDIGHIKLYKRKGAKAIKISIGADGSVRVTLPYWTPYQAGIRFVESKQSWIRDNLPITPNILTTGCTIGKTYRLVFEPHPEYAHPKARIEGSVIRVYRPKQSNNDDASVQKEAHKACVRALKREAEAHLPGRLRQLALTYGYDFNSVSVRQLKARWGSCTNKKDITLNLYLTQLPWELIDYVLLHELAHTIHMNHGPEFWRRLESDLPQARSLRKQIREKQPVLNAQTSIST